MHGNECAPLNNPPVWARHRSTHMRFPTPFGQLMADMEMRIITNGYTIQGVLPDHCLPTQVDLTDPNATFDIPRQTNRSQRRAQRKKRR